MTTLSHQHIVHKLNRSAEVERENARMDEIERASAPLMFAVAAVFLALMLAALTEDFLEMYHAKEDARVTSEAMIDCAKGRVIGFGDSAVMTCQVRELLK